MSFLTVEASTVNCTKNQGINSYKDIEDLVGRDIIVALRNHVFLSKLTFKHESQAKQAHRYAKELLKFCLGDEFQNIETKRAVLGINVPQLIERKDCVKHGGYYQILGINDPHTINYFLSRYLFGQSSSRTNEFWSVLPWSDNETKAA